MPSHLGCQTDTDRQTHTLTDTQHTKTDTLTEYKKSVPIKSDKLSTLLLHMNITCANDNEIVLPV